MSKIRLATVFSGVGAVEQALKKLSINKIIDSSEIIFACDNGERYLSHSTEELEKILSGKTYEEKKTQIRKIYDSTKKINHVKNAYIENYNIDESRWYDDIRFIDGNIYKNKVDLFVGGSPCQSFSISGKRAGLDDTRGTLFYDFARLIRDVKPKVFIFENVVGMLNHDKGKTWNVIKEVFDGLGYKIYHDVLNSKDFGIPQDRKRLFVVGFINDVKNFNFPKKQQLESKLSKFIESGPIEKRHYLGKKGFEFVTNSKYKNRARINKEVIQTQKANQQFNWNGDFIFEKLDLDIHKKDILERAHIGYYNGEKGVIRQLTYRECYNLMGFAQDFKVVVPNIHAYRQAGNSIVVNVLEEILKEILKVENFDEKN